ncbi:MAG: hypothetical protein ACR2PG_05515, partial [Hyphomicrobiaceae bacterium]
DLLVDDQTWRLRYLVAFLERSGSSAKHLVLPEDAAEISRPADIIDLYLSQSEFLACPSTVRHLPVSDHSQLDPSSAAFRDPHLRSLDTIGHYNVSASDGPLVHLHGLIVETSSWTVRYIIVDTGNFINAKLVLVAPLAIASIDWEREVILVSLTIGEVNACPEYDGDAELSRQYEAFLYDYYGWTPYWS